MSAYERAMAQADEAERPEHPYGLSDREMEIVALLVEEGATTDAMGRRLGLSISTVRTHLHNIYPKMGVVNKTQAAVRWIRDQEMEQDTPNACSGTEYHIGACGGTC